MAKQKPAPSSAPADLDLSDRDILFECPSCGKSLVVDESAEGMIIDCPQCKTNVIVPPRAASANGMSPPPPGQKHSETQVLPLPGRPDLAEESPAPPPVPPTAMAQALEAVGQPAEEETHAIAELHDQLTGLSKRLKEVQTQWADTTNRIATRINDVNRELVTLARLETHHQELLKEWNQLIGRLAETSREITKPLPAVPDKK